MKILVAYDGSSSADVAIADLKLAGFPPATECLVVTVANESWPPSRHPVLQHDPVERHWQFGIREAVIHAARGITQIQSPFQDGNVPAEPLWGKPAAILLKTIEHWKSD